MGASVPKAGLSVFEAVNETLREFYLGTTEMTPQALDTWFAARPLAAIAHWKEGEKISCRIIERGLRLEEAARFLEHYGRALTRIGWKVHGPARGPRP